jgi:hypothetical protein
MTDDSTEKAGLCGTCVHAQRIESAKGSVFLLCRLSSVDARFARYPALPVRQCGGYAALPGTTGTIGESGAGPRVH